MPTERDRLIALAARMLLQFEINQNNAHACIESIVDSKGIAKDYYSNITQRALTRLINTVIVEAKKRRK